MENPIAPARGIFNALVAVLIAGAVAAFFLLVLPKIIMAQVPTRLEFTIPTTDNKGNCTTPVDTVGSPGYVREVTYRTEPNSLVLLDSIGGGWYQRGALVTQFFGINTKPIPFGVWSFTSALYDSSGNTQGPCQVTMPVMFDGRPPSAIRNMVVR